MRPGIECGTFCPSVLIAEPFVTGKAAYYRFRTATEKIHEDHRIKLHIRNRIITKLIDQTILIKISVVNVMYPPHLMKF